jgi:glycosyltransferase involved in cell wall biosynthesis
MGSSGEVVGGPLKHLIICRELPPAPSGGIGTYAEHLVRLLAARSTETVHVIGQLWEGADREVETSFHGRLVVHRVPFEDWKSRHGTRPHPDLDDVPAALFKSMLRGQAFSWQASMLAERLVEEEDIDVVEAEDYEAPLYFFLLRRALGLGPRRKPPCFIHLHSPTEFIARHNGWDAGLPSALTATRLEHYCIAAADALLCPSAYLARQAERAYGLEPGTVTVIPLPVGDNPQVERDASTWTTGSILYTGRLERRKGILEWLEAAVRVAHDDPDVHFEFVGANVLGTTHLSGEALVERMLPHSLRSRFHFHGRQDRARLPQFMAKARLAVVPSRWENFPNTCVEAMSSGLPVLATSAGGMAEMVEDGESGWIVDSTSADELESGLRRALSTAPERLLQMGTAAAHRIRAICDNRRTIDRHLEFRRRVHQQGATRSLALPVNLPWAGAPFDHQRTVARDERSARELAVVITYDDGDATPHDHLTHVWNQSHAPAVIVQVQHRSPGLVEAVALDKDGRGWTMLHSTSNNVSQMRNLAVDTLEGYGSQAAGFVFMKGTERLRPEFLERCRDILERCPEVGLIGAWTRDPEPATCLCPAFPYHWMASEIVGPFAVRVDAVRDAGGFRGELADGYGTWDFANAVMASGWVAVTVPEVLSECVANHEELRDPNDDSTARRLIIGRFPNLIARDATALVLMLHPAKPRFVREAIAVLRDELDAVGATRPPKPGFLPRVGWKFAGFVSRALARALSRVSAS